MPSIEEVVGTGLCIGCGVCNVATAGKIPLTLSRYRQRTADLSNATRAELEVGSRVCPFANESNNEDDIAKTVFPDSGERHDGIGRYLSVRALRVNDEQYLLGSSSGGMTSWILKKLLEVGLVDGVIHVGQGENEPYAYRVSESVDEIVSNRKSAYYATSLDGVLRSILGNGKKYAVVGVPCFITAARNLAQINARVADQLAYFVGLVCGHLKTAAYGELLAWQVGIPPNELEQVDFRIKYRDRDAGDYGFGAKASESAEWKAKPARKLLGTNWGHALFQPESCNFCDDIFAETADVVLGDAWLEEYRQDWRGTNVVITRRAEIDSLIEQGISGRELSGDTLSPERAIESQAGNFRHRWDGLSVRLADRQAAGEWVPRKRQKVDIENVSPRRRTIARARAKISAESHEIFYEAREKNSLRHFRNRIKPLLKNYMKADFGPYLATVYTLFPLVRRLRISRSPIFRKALNAIRGSS